MTVLLLFSSLTHFLQGSGQRTGMAKAETCLCAQWPLFVLFFRFVFGLLSGWKFWTWPIIRFLTETVTYWLFYLLVFDGIHDAMCLNKMSRTSSRNIGPQHQKYSSVFHFTHGVLCILVFTKPILSVSGTGNGWERGPNCRRKKDLFYTKIKQTNKNYPVGEKTDWQTGWTGHKAGLDTRQDWTQGRTGHKAGLDTRQDWTQGRTGHKAYNNEPTYGNEPTRNCKHKEIIKGANEEGNEGEQLGKINQ